jgi:hypothetical protein
MFLAESGEANIGAWAWVNCGLFAFCGFFFIIVGYCYPEMGAKEIDTAKLGANVANAALT